jgi:hypothetical protein
MTNARCPSHPERWLCMTRIDKGRWDKHTYTVYVFCPVESCTDGGERPPTRPRRPRPDKRDEDIFSRALGEQS